MNTRQALAWLGSQIRLLRDETLKMKEVETTKEVMCRVCGKVFRILIDCKAILCPYCGKEIHETT